MLLTVERLFVAELEEKRSRFIAHLVPLSDFAQTLAALREEHRNASHHVTAFRQISDSNQISENAKDDGEPAGTSGMPVLKTLIGANLINAGMIVTRYFGGTKLGTGGLARAYAGAANAAIDAAHKIEWQRIERHEVSVSFALSSEVEHQIKLANLAVIERKFNSDGVVIIAEGAEKDIFAFRKMLNN